MTQVDVVICGGGPVGLSLAYLLGRAGVRTVLCEKRAGTTTLPKGQFVHASTAELYRQWGVWQQLDDAGWPIGASNGQGFYLRVALGTVAEVRQSAGDDAYYARKWADLSPVFPRKIPASDYEAALRRQAEAWPNVSLRFGTEVVDVAQHGDAVQVRVRHGDDEQDIRARYVVACDGARSFVRSRVAGGEDHGPTFGNQILTEFRASLDDTLGQDGFFHSFVLDPRYAGWFGSRHPQTGLWRYSFRHDEEALPDADDVRRRIRGALGMPDIDIEIVETYRFDYTTGLLRRWRENRVLFAGDAAHWHSPWGGYGANIGVQDANNLAWKLALVLRGAAPEALLDTYEAERKPRAQLAVKAATYNSLNFQAIVQATLLGEPDAARTGALSPQGVAFLRDALIRHGANSVLHTGFQLGTAYGCDEGDDDDRRVAVLRDGAIAPPASLEHYIESTVPGTRAPHVWLRRDDGTLLSTVDLWHGRFTLLVQRGAPAWRAAAARALDALDIDVDVVDLGPDGPYTTDAADAEKFDRLYALHDGDALLVRPDGFVARRLTARTAPGPALAETLRRLLGLAPAAEAGTAGAAMSAQPRAISRPVAAPIV